MNYVNEQLYIIQESLMKAVPAYIKASLSLLRTSIVVM